MAAAVFADIDVCSYIDPLRRVLSYLTNYRFETACKLCFSIGRPLPAENRFDLLITLCSCLLCVGSGSLSSQNTKPVNTFFPIEDIDHTQYAQILVYGFIAR